MRRGRRPACGSGMRARTVTLRDGTRALLRPIRPDDKERLRHGLELLSPRSRYLRFHSPIVRFTDTQLAYLTEVDQHDHVAWVALDPRVRGEPGMGVARFVRLPEEPSVAEAAVTVIDRYQGLGLGSALFGVLVDSAAANGIAALRNYVLDDNRPMLAVLDELGARRTPAERGVWQVDVPVSTGDPETGPAGRLLREVARGRLELGWHTALDWLHRRLVEGEQPDGDPPGDDTGPVDED